MLILLINLILSTKNIMEQDSENQQVCGARCCIWKIKNVYSTNQYIVCGALRSNRDSSNYRFNVGWKPPSQTIPKQGQGPLVPSNRCSDSTSSPAESKSEDNQPKNKASADDSLFSGNKLGGPRSKGPSRPGNRPAIQQSREKALAKLTEAKEEALQEIFDALKITEGRRISVDLSEICRKRPAPEELIRMAISDAESSKTVQAYIESLPDHSEVAKIRLVFQEQLAMIVSNISGCFTTISLIKKSEEFATFCEEYCLSNLAQLCEEKCALKVMQAVSERSSKFSNDFVKFFTRNFDHLQNNANTVMLLNKAIPNVTDERLLDFLVDRIDDLFNRKKQVLGSEMIRIIPNLLTNCSGSRLKRLIVTCTSKVSWLIDDKYGHFTAVSLFQAQFEKEHEQLFYSILADPLLLLTRKNRKLVLAKVLKANQYSNRFFNLFINALLRSNSESLLKILSKCQTAILLVLSAMTASDDRQACRRLLIQLEENLGNSIRQYNQGRDDQSQQGKLIIKTLHLLKDHLEIRTSEKH